MPKIELAKIVEWKGTSGAVVLSRVVGTPKFSIEELSALAAEAIPALLDWREEAIKVLKEIEYSSTLADDLNPKSGVYAACPVCNFSELEGHEQSCHLADLLGDLAAKPAPGLARG